jgi:hypothetical protein
MDEVLKKTGTRRRKKDGIDLEQMADAEIEDMRRRMTDAAKWDNEGRDRGEPAMHKLKLLPEVVALLNKNTLRESLVDPDINLLQAVRFFLEPLNDGSLPAYNIQRELFSALAKLPITKDSLVASGIGKVIMFYMKSKRPEFNIKRQAERLFADWTRPILKQSDDYRKKDFQQADYDPTYVPFVSPSLPIPLLTIKLGTFLFASSIQPTKQLPRKLPLARRRLRRRRSGSVREWKPVPPPTQSFRRVMFRLRRARFVVHLVQQATKLSGACGRGSWERPAVAEGRWNSRAGYVPVP